jgi:hypothetical protein
MGMVERYWADKKGRNIYKDKPREHIVFVYEKGTEGSVAVHQAFNAFYGLTGRLWCRDFIPLPKSVVQLHAADLIAYETNRLAREFHAGIVREPRHPIKQLVFGIPHWFMEPVGPAEIEDMLKQWDQFRESLIS